MTPRTQEPKIERRSGVALWRQVADHVRVIAAGPLPDRRMPTEAELALRFGVNRHTVRAATAHLIAEGVLRAEQGRGTFAVETRRLAYPITRRTRFHAGLEGQARALSGRLMEHGTGAAPPEVAAALALGAAAAAVRLETLSEADGRPVSRATSWFDATRFGDIALHFRRTGSITAALAACGVDDYVRRSTAVSARHASRAEADDLRLSPGAIVLEAVSVNADLAGRPIQFSRTRFAADRVELRVET